MFAFIRCFYSKPLLFQTAHPLFQNITCRLKKTIRHPNLNPPKSNASL
ncbi:hypothetical protein NEIFL0001_1860 [Neisseria flavescens SK114]|nr:hypothetical protein NEIFL0001_1860 [Neisseria flavescens SK114]